MGLSAPRKRTKISHDPNNTSWSRSTSGYGHKIMSSQGWTPGTFLGARNAAHADMFTAASAQHIKVTLKDDTFGLGARARRDPLNEPTGLDAFKGLLGRLNGKSDSELEIEQRHRDDIKLARYAATKWQEVRFVSAGYLIQEKPDTQSQDRVKERDSASRTSVEESASEGPKESSAESPHAPSEETGDERKKKRRRSKAEKASKSEDKQRRKKSKKRKLEPDSESLPQEDSDKSGSLDEHSSTSKEGDIAPQASTVATIRTRERLPLGRHVFRGRHIAQKKKALLDDKSLNEIFMVKA